ncbi:MAG: hypothetical protein GY696_38470, partial [Gammaproteobacteria bacterium]|nr:hypothetical protein [Gammaproteobacteria bacterium]
MTLTTVAHASPPSTNKLDHLRRMCNEMPIFEATCLAILQAKSSYFSSPNSKDEHPHRKCSDMGYCGRELTTQLARPRTLLLSDEALFSFGSGVQCQICITLVGISQNFIGVGRQAVIDACNTACDATIIFSAPCKQLISSVIDELLRLLSYISLQMKSAISWGCVGANTQLYSVPLILVPPFCRLSQESQSCKLGM